MNEMTSLALQLDNIDVCSSNSVCDSAEQITKLFPKCRPRSDINLNPIIISSTTKEHEITDNNAIDTVMNVERGSDRIIEIAGGREIFSQSRSKAARKTRNLMNNDEFDKKKSNKSPTSPSVWELRGSYGEAKKLKTTREFTETIFSSEVSSVKHQRLEKQFDNTEPVNVPLSPNEEATPGGDIVVFDDIGDSWQDLGVNYLENNKLEINETDIYDNSSTGMISDLDEIPESENDNKVAKVIGNLPIAVYEGSPRRYGPRHVDNFSQSQHPTLPSAHSLLASPSVYPPRPGFPQRVIYMPNENETGTTDVPPTDVDKSTPIASTFDYLYEFSETRKVLEEFFKCPPADEENRYESEFQDLDYELRRQANNSDGSGGGNSYVGQRLAKCLNEQNEMCLRVESPKKQNNSTFLDIQDHEVIEHENNFLDLSVGTGSSGDLGETEVGLQVGHSRNFTLSPETTDCDSNCGDLDSEVSLMLMDELGPSVGLLGSTGDLGLPSDSTRLYSSMPVLEDGLSSGHASDTDNNNPTVMLMKKQITEIEREIIHRTHNDNNKNKQENGILDNKECLNVIKLTSPIDSFHSYNNKSSSYSERDNQEHSVDTRAVTDITPPPPAPAPHRSIPDEHASYDVEAAIKDIRLTLQRTKILPIRSANGGEECEENTSSPIWVPRQRGLSGTSGESDTRKVQSGEEGGDEEADTDLETDRLLGQQRTDDQGFYDEKEKESKKKSRNKEGPCNSSVLIEGVLFRARYLGSTQLVCEGQPTKTTRMMQAEEAVSRIKEASNQSQSTYRLCAQPQSGFDEPLQPGTGTPLEESLSGTGTGPGTTAVPVNTVNIENTQQMSTSVYPAQLPLGVSASGTVFRLHYLGSVEVEEEGGRKRRKRLKKNMVEEAVIKIKAPDGETQPSTEVDLFISTEKIMVLNTDLKEIMMDHALRTISYIADIGDLVVLMARRRFVPHEMDEPPKISRTPKMICHVFESEEAQFIAQSIGQAFQVAYMEFLKANGIEDHSFVKEMDYQEVLNSQEIFGDELQMFAKKEMQKEVVVPKAKGEILGVVIVESGWGSMLPTVVIANLAPAGAAARCGQLNIGDQIIAINGVSLVGLPLSTCQTYIKNSKNQTVVKLTVVPCAPVVEVKIKRPDTKYQLGFSVQNGVICSLLRGGIAERGGVRVGHRIIEINNQSVVAVPHEKIVNLLATSVGEILMKTMPTSMFRLLTGQENPVYI